MPWRGATSTPRTDFGEGIVPALIRDIACRGNETALQDCLYSNVVDNICFPYRVRGVGVDSEHGVNLRCTPLDDVRWFDIEGAMNTIKAPQAWDVYDGRGGTDIPVCVIGDGIDFTHPDLRANMHPDVGYDVTTGDQGEAVSFDQESSSTHHAGTIAGVGNNSIGIAGVAWGGNAKLLGCKLTTDTSESGLAAKFAECLSWCRHQEAWIAYSTHGFDMPVGMLEDAAKAYDAWGGLLVLSSLQRNSNADDNPTYPHQYQLSSVMVVNALNSTSKELLSPSDFGANTTHLFAPGNNIYSTVPNDRYSYLSGPGQGAALVAGAAALLW
eukprot:362992-Chlamydomonas_euryale.AAC.1